jgi:hypothetical protein
LARKGFFSFSFPFFQSKEKRFKPLSRAKKNALRQGKSHKKRPETGEKGLLKGKKQFLSQYSSR